MRVLLTGAGGFTGRHFAIHARAAGHEVRPLECDLTEPQQVDAALDAALQGLPAGAPWALVHLAAISYVAHAHELAFYQVNVLGSLHLLAAAARHPRPARVLLASSANVYGNSPHSPLTEDHVPAPVNHYAASKLAMEHLARAHGAGLPLILARPFNYTGPGQAPHFLIPKLVQHFAARAPRISLGNLHVEREYNDVDFVCRSYLHLLDHGEPGRTYNVCTGTTWSLSEVLALLQRLTGHAIEVQIDPALVRRNEIARLSGDPARLQAVWQRAGDPAWPATAALQATLQRMLAAGAPA